MMEEAGGSAPKEAPAAAEAKAVDPKAIRVSIADALNEQDIVKFTVHTQTELDRFAKK